MTAPDRDIPFKLHSCCLLVKGASRSAVCDIQRNQIHLIPHILHDILVDFDGKTVAQVKANYKYEYDEIIDEYFEFLQEEEIVFNTTTPASFPAMSLQWHSPFTIANCIIDLDESSSVNFNEIACSLNNLDCRNLEIRSYAYNTPAFFDEAVRAFMGTTVLAISIVTKFANEPEIEEWQELCDKYSRLVSLSFHGAPESKTLISVAYQTPIVLAEAEIANETCCGKISEQNFSALTETFTEALRFNTCLNGKISIDRHGNIKNCPSTPTILGHIGSDKLETIAEDPRLKAYWGITKDRVQVCKDCEFRYVCMDCRAYIEDPDNIYSKPLKCGYDPYTATWEDWTTNPIKVNAKNHYNL